MKRLSAFLISLSGLSSTLSPLAAQAVEPPVGDTATKAPDTSARVREMAVCLWQNNREAALRLSGQEMAQWAEKSRQFRFANAEFAACGVQNELAFLSQNIDSITVNLHLIRLNQVARCVIRSNMVNIADTFDKLVAQKSPLFVGRLANQSNETKVKVAFNLGAHLPPELTAAASTCDADVGAWADSDSVSRTLLAEELSYEAKRNA